jgi:hypothetical protein
MRAARHFALIATALTLLANLAPAGAGTVTVVLNNLDQMPEPTGSSPFVGQSFIAGADQTLHGAQMQLSPTVPPSSNIMLELEARNPDGTAGQTLFSDFSASYDQRSGLITFLADSSFHLVAGTGYWLVLSDPTAGSVTWNYTASQIYQSQFGYGLPSYNTSFYSDQDNGSGNIGYYQPSDGPQMFDLITMNGVVDEPPSAVLLGLGVAIAVVILRHRGSRSFGLPRLQPGRVHQAVRPSGS